MKTADMLSTKRDPKHNYSAPGTYHLFFETEEGKDVLGQIHRGRMMLNAFGEIFLTVLAFALHRFPCVHVRAMDIRPHCVEMVVVLSGWRQKLKSFVDEAKRKLNWRRTMTVPLFVGYVKMNSGRQINGQLGVCNVAVWTRRYKARVMTDEAEIAQLCAELDRRYAKVRLEVKKESGGEPAVSLASVLYSALGGLLNDQPSRSASLDAPEREFDTMLLGRALFLTSQMLHPLSEADDRESEAGVADSPGVGGRAPASRIWSVGPGKILVSGPSSAN